MNRDTVRLEWAKEALSRIVMTPDRDEETQIAYKALMRILADEQSTAKPTHPTIARQHT